MNRDGSALELLRPCDVRDIASSLRAIAQVTPVAPAPNHTSHRRA
jgi:hypothetical protein